MSELNLSAIQAFSLVLISYIFRKKYPRRVQVIYVCSNNPALGRYSVLSEIAT